MIKYILNSAVITAPGTYEYRHISEMEMAEWIHEGDWESCIGYQETADALRRVCGSLKKIPVDRRVITMQAGDEALVFRLVFPQGYRPDPVQKGSLGMEYILAHCEMGILRRLR